MSVRVFDLNIKEVLENWEVEHALREVIANALDEQLLSSTKEIEIFKDSRGYWHVRDFGRGLRIEHFTLNEDQEKLNSDLPIIGKFGVGLKDALATFHRRDIRLFIQSQYGTFRLREVSKHGFDNIITLHVEFDDEPPSIMGTEFILDGVADVDITKAKSLFMRFADEKVLDTTQYGTILRRLPDTTTGKVYILGVLASEEPNFLFSYNITSLTEAMKKRLNRERLNVGRTTYTDRIKMILRSSTSQEVHNELINQVNRRAYGDQSDEMTWIEISQFALNLMHQNTSVAYVTEEELQRRPDLVNSAKADGHQVVVITEQQKEKIEQQVVSGGPQLRTLDVYAEEFNESFQYQFVEPKQLNIQERAIFNLTFPILALVNLHSPRVPDVRISE
ncbi:MAG: ATP-binding protein, partial [Chloroflexi bacterium]|nr:ATP-binding protein [Chloroflexota bacterium]